MGMGGGHRDTVSSPHALRPIVPRRAGSFSRSCSALSAHSNRDKDDGLGLPFRPLGLGRVLGVVELVELGGGGHLSISSDSGNGRKPSLADMMNLSTTRQARSMASTLSLSFLPINPPCHCTALVFSRVESHGLQIRSSFRIRSQERLRSKSVSSLSGSR